MAANQISDLYPTVYAFGSNEFGQIFQELPPDVGGDEIKQKYLFPKAWSSNRFVDKASLIGVHSMYTIISVCAPR